MEKNENIVSKLIEMGLSAEGIQKAYERYLWHIEYYPKKLEELKLYLDLQIKNSGYAMQESAYNDVLCKIGELGL